MVLDILSVKPLEYHMKNLWNQTSTNVELDSKIKGMITEFYLNSQFESLGNYLTELKCQNYYHEFVKQTFEIGMEKVRKQNIISVLG
jgi:hypothetical protein